MSQERRVFNGPGHVFLWFIPLLATMWPLSAPTLLGLIILLVVGPAGLIVLLPGKLTTSFIMAAAWINVLMIQQTFILRQQNILQYGKWASMGRERERTEIFRQQLKGDFCLVCLCYTRAKLIHLYVDSFMKERGTVFTRHPIPICINGLLMRSYNPYGIWKR